MRLCTSLDSPPRYKHVVMKYKLIAQLDYLCIVNNNVIWMYVMIRWLPFTIIQICDKRAWFPFIEPLNTIE